MNTAFLFPGQGAQTLGMGEDFRTAFASVARRLQQVDAGLGIDLRAIITRGPPRMLAQTRYAQPAIFALSYAIGELFVTRGLQPDIVAGHSLGELSAMTMAGAMSFEQALALVIERGRLMHEVNVSLDGGMMAVSGIDANRLSDILNGFRDAVWIANENAPSQVVLSGMRAALQKVAQLIAASGGRTTWFDVAGPYHTPLLAEASQAFARHVALVSMRDPVCPVIANTNAEALLGAAAIQTELSHHMVRAIDWTGTMRKIADSGACLAIEVGPGRVMKGLTLRNVPALTCLTSGTVREFEATWRCVESRLCASL